MRRGDKVTLRWACPIGDLMVLGRAGLDINETINDDPLATLAGGPCLRAPGLGKLNKADDLLVA